jgi:hypothetical protein
MNGKGLPDHLLPKIFRSQSHRRKAINVWIPSEDYQYFKQ